MHALKKKVAFYLVFYSHGLRHWLGKATKDLSKIQTYGI